MDLIAIGANLHAADGTSPRATCEWAVRQLAALPGLRRLRVSSWFQTLPEPPSGQPLYTNGAVAMEWLADGPDPATLLALLQAMEARAGRRRSVPNAARTLDLDIVAMAQTVRTGPDPVLPHPRMHLRRFVLEPLSEVAPDWTHPVQRRTVRQLLAALEPPPEQQG